MPFNFINGSNSCLIPCFILTLRVLTSLAVSVYSNNLDNSCKLYNNQLAMSILYFNSPGGTLYFFNIVASVSSFNQELNNKEVFIVSKKLSENSSLCSNLY